MKQQTFTSMVLACLCVGAVHSQAADAAVSDESSAEPVVSVREARRAEIEAARERALKMREPRDAFMAEVSDLNGRIDARRKAILESNEEAAGLDAEIKALDKALQEKSAALSAILDDDEEIVSLRAKLNAAREGFSKSQIKLRSEIARQHRERRQRERLAREAAAKAAAAEKADSDGSGQDEQGPHAAD